MSDGLPDQVPGLSEAEADARFQALQRKLVPLWTSIQRFNQDEQTIVVIPSLSVDKVVTGAQMQAYEERFLFLLLLLRQPRARLVYVTSQVVHPAIIDYYLDLLPGVIPSHARRRLFLVSPMDGSPRPLSRKLLERPRLLERIRGLVPDPDRAHLVFFSATRVERDLALLLGLPMYGSDPRHLHFGTKSGCRRLFREEGVPHPLGREDLTSAADVAEAIVAMRRERPGLEQVLLKLNEGVSGEGNALVDLGGMPEPGSAAEAAGVRARVDSCRLELEGGSRDAYFEKLGRAGGVVEERIRGEEFRSPSVQLRVTPLGTLEVLSTHDQVLGGYSGQIYQGCRFPADPAYARAITSEAVKVGERLAREGVLGRFALDFVAVREAAGWRPYAIELNLRKGGTTHPFLTLQFLTDGRYDAETACFTAPNGRCKHLLASDHVHSPLFRAFTPDDVFDIAVRHGLHFHATHETGVVFHMLSALGESGHLGLVAVGDGPAQAEELYARAVALLEEEAARAVAPLPVPPLA
jgi:hypothetical protein